MPGLQSLTDFLYTCNVKDVVLPREVFIQNCTKVLIIVNNVKGSASTSDVDINRGGAVGSSWQDECRRRKFESRAPDHEQKGTY